MREKILQKKTVFGTMLSEISTPNIARIMKTAGFEFLIVDCEHGYFDFTQTANLIAIGNCISLPVIIRIPSIERKFITKVLDMGADGLLVPMVNTKEEAVNIIDCCKYFPDGHRGISTTRAHTNYAPPPLCEYMAAANKRTMIFVQIETLKGVENAERIAKVEGIDALMIGPNDLAVAFGRPGDLECEDMQKAIRKVITCAKNAGKSCGIIESHPNFLKKWENEGMNVFSCSSEVSMILSAGRGIIKEFVKK